MIEESNFTKILMGIGRKELDSFENHNILYAECLYETNCRRHIMRWVYHGLVCNKRIIALELLPVDKQEDVKNFVEDICSGKDVNEVVKDEMAKVFYALEYFINEAN